MVVIAYGVLGVGLGHSARCQRIVDALLKKRKDLSIIILTSSLSYDLLSNIYKKEKRIRLKKIWSYKYLVENERINFVKTFFQVILPAFFVTRWKRLKVISKFLKKEKVKFLVIDFEPVSSRAAIKNNIPFVSINHPMILRFGNFKLFKIHKEQRMSFICAKIITHLMQPVKGGVFVTSFFKTKKLTGGARLIGPILREGIIKSRKKVKDKGFVLVYLKDTLNNTIRKVISKDKDHRFVVYVKNPQKYKDTKNAKYKQISLVSFTKDLVNCSCVVSTAGNQLISEAVYLGKPLLVIPERNQFEQSFNAKMLVKEGFGTSVQREGFNKDTLNKFIKDVNKYKYKRGLADDTYLVVDDILKKIDKLK